MEERPQYRAYNQGFDTLTNVDLISLVINRGAGTKDSQEQARQIYNIMGNSLRNIGKARIEDLEVVPGIGDCKAVEVPSRAYMVRMANRLSSIPSWQP